MYYCRPTGLHSLHIFQYLGEGSICLLLNHHLKAISCAVMFEEGDGRRRYKHSRLQAGEHFLESVVSSFASQRCVPET